ncbi:MAG: type III polyketide synthase [Ktedonobacterales bacterium]
MAHHPRVLATAAAFPPYQYRQDVILAHALEHILGPEWRTHEEASRQAHQIERLFRASHVEQRHSAVDLGAYYRHPRSTGERMAEYQRAAYTLGRTAVESCLRDVGERHPAATISDFVAVSCTGYSAPGLDVQLPRELGMPRDVRRVVVGHMGCFGAIVGLRQCLTAVRAYPGATAALVSVELTTLHFAPTLNPEVLTSFALFGDAAAAVLLSNDEDATGPELVDTYCAADFDSADQMTWTITDQGFVMTLSPRVPVTLRRNIASVVDHLLDPHGLQVRDITHWLVHPGGPSILEVIQARLELSDEQMAPSWEALRDYGNCSSATVLIMLDALLRSGRTSRGEWGVMMAFGPGLTLETCLFRF